MTTKLAFLWLKRIAILLNHNVAFISQNKGAFEDDEKISTTE
jgi:hypothetical protein